VQQSRSSTDGWVTVADGVSTATTATVFGLTNGARVFLRVAARTAAGTGANSTVVSAIPRTVPAPPTTTSATSEASPDLSRVSAAENSLSFRSCPMMACHGGCDPHLPTLAPASGPRPDGRTRLRAVSRSGSRVRRRLAVAEGAAVNGGRVSAQRRFGRLERHEPTPCGATRSSHRWSSRPASNYELPPRAVEDVAVRVDARPRHRRRAARRLL
jgi:hypothetical protein